MYCLIFDCLHRWGIKHIFIVDIHGDHMNGIALYEAIVEGRKSLGFDIRSVISHWIARDLGIDHGNDNFLIFHVDFPEQPRPQYVEVHAGESGTAGMQLKHFLKLVNVEVAKKLQPTNLTFEDLKKWQDGVEIARNITPLGYFGAPADYDKVNIDEIDFVEIFSEFATIGLIDYLKKM